MSGDFAKRLKVSRAIAGVSARELAAATGITRAVIANIESGRKAGITVDEVVAFAAALNITTGDLDERLAAPETKESRADYRAGLIAQINRLQAELESVTP